MISHDFVIAESFRSTYGGYIAAHAYLEHPSSPPWIIASVASSRISPDASLNLPDGVDGNYLSELQEATEVTGVGGEVYIDQEKAVGVAEIGRQILELDEHGGIQPPLNEFESQSIEYLTWLVGKRAVSAVN